MAYISLVLLTGVEDDVGRDLETARRGIEEAVERRPELYGGWVA